MIRRIHVEQVCVGQVTLGAAEAHHARDVLRLATGTGVELFDDSGMVGSGVIVVINSASVVVQVDRLNEQHSGGVRLTVAAAVPKGDRADWMVEKLSELGVSRFVPLMTARSVVHPTGKNKLERWERLAVESAKQCRRAGVMTVGELTPLAAAVSAVTSSAGAGWYLSTADDSKPVVEVLAGVDQAASLSLFIGPEGGWTDVEMAAFSAAGFVGVGLTQTILRVETAATAAAAVVMCGRIARRGSGTLTD